MRYNILGLLVAGGLWLGTASTADCAILAVDRESLRGRDCDRVRISVG